MAFAFLCSTIVIWAGGYTLEFSSTTLQGKHFWSSLTFIGIALLPPSWFIFGLYFTGRSHWLTRGRIAMLLILPCITLLMTWTNDAHGLMFYNAQLEVTGGLYTETSDYGIWFWIHAGYSYLLLAVGSGLVIARVWNGRSVYRWQAVFIMVAAMIPWVANVVRVFKLIPMPLDLTSVA